METLSVTFAGDPQTYHVITDCNESDTCPGCGAGYKVGLSACEYCRRPVRHTPAKQYRVHQGETIIPKAWA